MDEREEREREMEMKNKADHDAGNTGGSNPADAMDVDEPPAPENDEVSSERIEAFQAIFGQHMFSNRLEQISITELEQVVNREAAANYSSSQILSVLKIMEDANRVMVTGGVVRLV